MMIPITRKEKYINEIVGGGDTAPKTPQTREEFFFAEILGEVIAPSPVTRVEKYLSAIAGQYSGDLPTPTTRTEYFLAKAAGMEIETPIPITREEMLWDTYIPIKTIEGIPPLTFKAKKAGTLKDYRIYGNTAGGESVGDLVAEGEHAGEYKVAVKVEGKNLLPMSTTPIDTDVDDFHCEYDGAGTITLTTDKDNAVLDSFSIPLSEDFIIPISVGQGGDGCVQFNNSIATSVNSNVDHLSVNFYYNMTFIDSWGLTTINRIHSTYSSMGGKTINRVVIDIKGAGFSTNRKIVIQPAFVLNTTEQVPFEPYHAPITTPIYLPEQIRKVGDEAEYIDYAEQKQHRVRKNLLKNIAKSQTINGVTFTVNSDGSVTCNGKCVNNVAVLYIKRPTTFYDETIQYTLTGCPVGGAYNSTYALEYTNSVNQVKPDVGNGVSFTPYRKAIYPNACIRIVIFVGYICDNLTFYPMIRKADIEDDTYEPYIENTDIDVTLPALPTIKGTNVLSVGTEVQPSSVEIKGKIQEVTP